MNLDELMCIIIEANLHNANLNTSDLIETRFKGLLLHSQRNDLFQVFGFGITERSFLYLSIMHHLLRKRRGS